jgi:hypothetical protein
MGYPEVRLRSAPAPDEMLCIDDCRDLVESRIEGFLS